MMGTAIKPYFNSIFFWQNFIQLNLGLFLNVSNDGLILIISKKDQQAPTRYSRTISCGDTIEPGQKVRLKQDLNCAETDFEAAITINGPAVLDLNGHTITGHDQMEGIVVQGSPSFEFGPYQRSYALFRNLPKLRNQIIELEKKVADLSEDVKS